MSIIISNISPKDAPVEGINKYVVKINQRAICEFEHDRKIDGLAQCLRDAADAVEQVKEPLYKKQFMDMMYECGVLKEGMTSKEIIKQLEELKSGRKEMGL